MANHRRLLALVATGMIVAACSSTPASTGTAAPGAGATPPPTEAPSATPTIGDTTGSPEATGASETAEFGTAADLLDQLDSYKFSVDIQTTASQGGASSTTMSGTVVNSPDKAYTLDITTTDAGTTSTTNIVSIGDRFWLGTDGGPLEEQPAALASQFIATYAQFRPEKLFGAYFGSIGSFFTSAGDETHNGVPSTHFKGNDSINAVFSALSGVAASYQAEVWLAKDGGYLVGSKVTTSGATASASGSYSSDVEITNVNDPANEIKPPS